MTDEHDLARSAEMIEQLLGDRQLRERFHADPAAVLDEHGLSAPEHGKVRKALMTLELRESRSSLAGVMVGAAAESVDLGHVVEHAVPGVGRGIGHFFGKLAKSFSHHPAHPAVKPAAHPAVKPKADSVALPSKPVEPAVPAPEPVAKTSQLPDSATLPPAPVPGGGGAGGGGGVDDPPVPVGPPTDAAPGAAAHAHGHGAHHALPHAKAEAELLRYPGNNATPQQIAAWMGAHAKAAGLPPELPVMAALTESGLHNLNYGDRDSVGFFQMRVGIWNEGPYAGFATHPEKQIKWFIQHALAVRAENPALAQSSSTWGEWVADVEQPAEQFRGRYQLQLGAAQELLGHTNLAHVHVGDADASGNVVGGGSQHREHADRVGKRALKVAERYMGTPYQWGGSNPSTGFDCSGLVQWSFRQVGIELPRTAAEQFEVGVPVARDHLKPGDAIFFAEPNGFIHHVGIYIGNGKFIDAPETGEDVRIDSLSEPYFAQQYAGARSFTSLAPPSNYARPVPTVKG